LTNLPTNNLYTFTVPPGTRVEGTGYGLSGTTVTLNGRTNLTENEIRAAVYVVGGFRINNLIDIDDKAASGNCNYQVVSAATSVSSGIKALTLNATYMAQKI